MGIPVRNISAITSAALTQIEGSVWDAAATSHSTTGTYGARAGVERIIGSRTFDNTAGNGASGGNSVWYTVTGQIEVVRIIPRITTTLTGATATISLGTADTTTKFIAASLATSMTSNKFWFDAATIIYDELAIPAACKEIVIDSNVVSAVAVAGITGGVLSIILEWVPLSSGATVVKAAGVT